MFEGMAAASLRELFAEKGCTDEECTLLGRIVARRHEMDELSTTCLDSEWGWRTEYESLRLDEVVLRADSLIARHESRLNDFALCLKQLRPLLEEVTELSQEVVGQMDRTGRFKESRQLTKLIAVVVIKTNERFFGTLGDLYLLLLDIERGYVEYFHHLKTTARPDKTQMLSRPGRLVELERRVLARIHQNATDRAWEAELYHGVAPSPRTAARLALAMVQARFYGLGNTFNRLDAPPDAQKLRELAQEARGLVGIINEAATVGRAAAPIVLASYERVVEDLQRLEGTAEAYATDISALSFEDRAELLRVVRKRSDEFIEVAGRIDRELSRIDRMFKVAS